MTRYNRGGHGHEAVPHSANPSRSTLKHHILQYVYPHVADCCERCAFQGLGLPDSAWYQVFAATDAGLQCEDGCTATALLAWRDEVGALCLQAANVGDSAAAWSRLPPGLHVPALTPLSTSPGRCNPHSSGATFAMGRPAAIPPRWHAAQLEESPVQSPVRGHQQAVAEGHDWAPSLGEETGGVQQGQEEVQVLTADHRLTAPGERQRLAALGIQLSEGRTRLYGLNLARCLGDKFLKVGIHYCDSLKLRVASCRHCGAIEYVTHNGIHWLVVWTPNMSYPPFVALWPGHVHVM